MIFSLETPAIVIQLFKHFFSVNLLEKKCLNTESILNKTTQRKILFLVVCVSFFIIFQPKKRKVVFCIQKSLLQDYEKSMVRSLFCFY